MKIHKNQSGFSHVEILLIIIIVTLISVVGWFVYDRNNKGSSNNTPATKQITNFDECAAAGNPIMESYPEQCRANGQTFTKNVSTRSAQQNVKYLEIKELGVKFQLSDSIAQAYYYIGNDGNTAYFSLESFKGTECSADKTSQVALTGYSETEISNDPNPESRKKELKKIGMYYYLISRGQAPCGDDEPTQSAGVDMGTNFIKSLSTSLQQL